MVKPKKQVPKVAVGSAVVAVVVVRRPEAEHLKRRVPRVRFVRVNEAQPVRVHGAKRHVAPHVRRANNVRCKKTTERSPCTECRRPTRRRAS